MTKTTAIILRELATPEEWAAMFKLVKHQNREITQKEFKSLLAEMRARHYRCLGAYAGSKLVGIMGFWIAVRFWNRKHVDIDNVVIDEKWRSKGIGKKMLAWVEREARKQGCTMAVLDSYTTAHKAHRFYFREGYGILGYHFTKHL